MDCGRLLYFLRTRYLSRDLYDTQMATASISCVPRLSAYLDRSGLTESRALGLSATWSARSVYRPWKRRMQAIGGSESLVAAVEFEERKRLCPDDVGAGG